VKSMLLLTGIGLRTPHYSEFLEKRPGVAWLEVHSENYFGEGGKSLYFLEKIRRDYPVSLHGVSLSLGSADELNWQHVKKIRDLITRIDPCLISDHLSWSSINGRYLHDLLPLPYTDEALTHVVRRIQQIQDYLKRQLLIENISSYVHYQNSTMTEWDFLKEVAIKSGCGILLDINNIYVNATNLGFNPHTYVSAIPAKLVQELHLAGFTTTVIDEKEVLIDTHNRPVVPAVWDLYRNAIRHLGAKPTIIEWDSDLPALETLYLEAYRAEHIMRETYVAAKLTG
jgi:uncharacterized protein